MLKAKDIRNASTFQKLKIAYRLFTAQTFASPKTRRSAGRVNTKAPLRDRDQLFEYAQNKLMEADFILDSESKSTETVYYRRPGCHMTMRVSKHRRQTSWHPRGYLVATTITIPKDVPQFQGKVRLSDRKIDDIIARAIGYYMLNTGTNNNSNSDNKHK